MVMAWFSHIVASSFHVICTDKKSYKCILNSYLLLVGYSITELLRFISFIISLSQKILGIILWRKAKRDLVVQKERIIKLIIDKNGGKGFNI